MEISFPSIVRNLRNMSKKHIWPFPTFLSTPFRSLDDSFLIPDDFNELQFEVHGHRDNHSDMGQFYAFLKQHNLGAMFKELFGIEGQ